MFVTSRLLKPAIVAVTALTPGVALAGSYGNTAVRDGAVANSTTEQATVLCPRLERRIPETLAAQMDCGVGEARPAVAGARVRNNPIANFFDRFPHRPSNIAEPDDDGDGPVIRRTSAPDDDVASPDGPGPTPTPTPPTGGGGSGSKPKWDRLNDLGITRENFDDQPIEVRRNIVSHAKNTPRDGDWSDFELD